MSSGTDPGVPEYPGAVVEAICTGCKTEAAHRVLERSVAPRDISPGVTFKDTCSECWSVQPHNILEVHQEILVPLGGVSTHTVTHGG